VAGVSLRRALPSETREHTESPDYEQPQGREVNQQTDSAYHKHVPANGREITTSRSIRSCFARMAPFLLRPGACSGHQAGQAQILKTGAVKAAVVDSADSDSAEEDSAPATSESAACSSS